MLPDYFLDGKRFNYTPRDLDELCCFPRNYFISNGLKSYDFFYPIFHFVFPYIRQKIHRKTHETPDKIYFKLYVKYKQLRRSIDAFNEAKTALKLLEIHIGRQNEKEGIVNPRNKSYN